MDDRIKTFWIALGQLTFAETVQVAETLRDAWETVGEFEHTDVHDWAFFLNSAREIGEAREDV